MRSNRRISKVPNNVISQTDCVKVATGEYVTESEVRRDGLRAILASDQPIDAWLRTEVAAAYDAIKKDPARAVPASKVRAHLMEMHRQGSPQSGLSGE